MKASISIPRLVYSVILLMIVGSFLGFYFLKGQPSPWPPLVANHRSSTSVLWARQNIYMHPSEHTRLIVVGDKLILIGSDALNNPVRLIALDKNTGKIIWEYGNIEEIVLAALPSTIFVGEVGNVVALNPDNGKVVWSTSLPFTRSVTKLLFRDNILYVDTVSENHFLLDAGTGKIIQSISYASGGVPIWSNHEMDLEIVANNMYFQKQTGISSEVEIVAIEEQSGNQLWISNVLAASKIAVNSQGVYILSLDGKLLRFDTLTGSKSELIQFTPALAERYYSERGTAQDYGYYVAVDPDNQFVYVYLGDGAQLFAFKISLIP